VLLTSERIPTIVSSSLGRNVAVRSVGNSNADRTKVGLVASNNSVWRLESSVADELMARNFDPGEVAGGVFSTTKRIPAGVSRGLARNVSFRSMSNGNPKRTKVGLVALWSGRTWLRELLVSQQHKRRADDPVKVMGGVFCTAIRIPAFVSGSLARDVAVGGVCNGTEKRAKVWLMTTSNGARRRTTSIAHHLVASGNNPGEIACLVLFSTVGIPSFISSSFARNVSILRVGDGEVQRTEIWLVTLRSERRRSRTAYEWECYMVRKI